MYIQRLNTSSITLENQGKDELSTSLLYQLLTLLEAEYAEGDKYSINLARLAYAMARLESRVKEDKKEKYTELKKNVYKWAQNPEDRKDLITAINLLVYIYREKQKVEVK